MQPPRAPAHAPSLRPDALHRPALYPDETGPERSLGAASEGGCAGTRGGAEDDGGYLQMDDILINDRVFETAKNLRAKQVDVSIVPRTADLNGTGQRSSEIDPLVVELKQGDGQVVGVDNSHLGVG